MSRYDGIKDYLSKIDKGLIPTPELIAKQMVDLIPDTIWSRQDLHKVRFLDICCKSGVFPVAIKEKLKTLEHFTSQYKSEDELDEVIYNMIYCLAPTEQCAEIIRGELYDDCDYEGNVKVITTDYNNFIKLFKLDYNTPKNKQNTIRDSLNTQLKLLVDKIENTFKDLEGNSVKFDVVIGNPPYNNDIYLDFVQISKGLIGGGQHSCVCMITPAKWQAKGGIKNKQFRFDIVPYIKELTYYPDCTDVFAIGDPGGISYYLINNEIHKEKIITNVSLKHKALNKNIYNDINTRNFEEMCLSNFGSKLIQKLKDNKSFKVESTDKNKRYEAWSANKVSLVSNIPKTCLWSESGVFNCLGLIEIIDITKGNKYSFRVPEDSRLIYTADTKEECEYFKSWAYTRFVRFMISLSLCGLTGIATSNEWWRFVPDPGPFDHIFTDQELYEKYNLTEEEINIIESIIKERK